MTRTLVPILMYHNVGVPPHNAVLRSMYVRPGAFARQMGLLRRLGYRGVSMSEAMPVLRGERRERVVAITFDDGYSDILDNALPVLQRLGFTATCYFVSDALGGANDWDAGVIAERKPLMDASQLRRWADAGMEVGAHSRHHPHLPQCDDRRLQDEVVGCRYKLEQLCGRDVTQFCYPYGDCDARTVEAVRAAGYVAATTTRRGRARVGEDLMQLRRVLVGGHNWLPQFAVKLLTPYEDRKG